MDNLLNKMTHSDYVSQIRIVISTFQTIPRSPKSLIKNDIIIVLSITSKFEANVLTRFGPKQITYYALHYMTMSQDNNVKYSHDKWYDAFDGNWRDVHNV